MTPPSHTADVLNAFQWDRAKTLPAGTLIFGGEDSETFRRQVREQLRKHCGDNAARMIGASESAPAGVMIKSALMVSAFSRVMRFPGTFTDDTAARAFYDSSGKVAKVFGFGTSGTQSESYHDAVRVLDDDLKGCFCLALKVSGESKDHPDSLVLLRAPSLGNFQEAFHHIHTLLTKVRQPQREIEIAGQKYSYKDTLEADDILWLPELHAALSTDFSDLVGKQYLRQGGAWWQISIAQQLLNFRLNHEGALATAVFKIRADFLTGSADSQGSSAPVRPGRYQKIFVFNKPFVASFWREGADYPYLACWIDGPEMLVTKR